MKVVVRRLIPSALMLAAIFSCKVVPTPSTQPKDEIAEQNQIPDESIIEEVVEVLGPDTVAIGIHRLKRDTFTITGVGDIMLGTNYPSAEYLPPEQGKYLLVEVNNILNEADLTFGNLEGVILNQGGKPKRCNNPSLCYLFRTPESFVTHLVAAGFDILSLANNHAGDFGEEGIKNTMKVLDSAGIHHAGSLHQPFIKFGKKGMRYGFAAFAPNTGTLSIHDFDNARRVIAGLDSLADIVIVSFHGGAEGPEHRNITRRSEFFFGEDRGNVYQFAHLAVDWGADIVLGHGPHVTRALELYNNRLIAYSLGNFCTYARFNLRGVNGIAPIITVYSDSKGEFLGAKIISIIQTGLGVPKLDIQQRALQEIIELTRSDFPETPLAFSSNGIVSKIKNQ